jgi:FMN phosphatase YigB (HAD superfamily)
MDVIFDRDPKVYLEAIRHLSLEPHEVAMVAAHAFDLRAAAKLGMRTFYVHRNQEEKDPDLEAIKSKEDGGEFDVVTGSFLELDTAIGNKEG